jgi:hypothetical protein
MQWGRDLALTLVATASAWTPAPYLKKTQMELTVSADSTLSMWRKMEVRDGDGYEVDEHKWRTISEASHKHN